MQDSSSGPEPIFVGCVVSDCPPTSGSTFEGPTTVHVHGTVYRGGAPLTGVTTHLDFIPPFSLTVTLLGGIADTDPATGTYSVDLRGASVCQGMLVNAHFVLPDSTWVGLPAAQPLVGDLPTPCPDTVTADDIVFPDP